MINHMLYAVIYNGDQNLISTILETDHINLSAHLMITLYDGFTTIGGSILHVAIFTPHCNEDQKIDLITMLLKQMLKQDITIDSLKNSNNKNALQYAAVLKYDKIATVIGDFIKEQNEQQKNLTMTNASDQLENNARV